MAQHLHNIIILAPLLDQLPDKTTEDLWGTWVGGQVNKVYGCNETVHAVLPDRG
jgi:hypothetical protein